jgi:glycosyltransferase involved in cell wall biosynthesis
VHIALVTTSWPVDEHDPAGHFVRAHARQLERAGNVVTVLAPKPGGAFGWPGVPERIRERPLRALSAARWVASARTHLRKLDVDRVVAHWALPSAWPIAAGSRFPLEVVSHGGDVRLLVGLPHAARVGVVRRLVARVADWQFVSGDLLEQLLETLDLKTRAHLARVARVQPAPIEIPNVTSTIAELRRDLGACRVAVSVGRLVRSKRVDRGIEHVSRSRDIQKLIVVGDGPERASLQRLARDLGVDALFVGAVGRPQALAWIGAADVLLHASEAEGLSTVVREAEALGTPVIRI